MAVIDLRHGVLTEAIHAVIRACYSSHMGEGKNAHDVQNQPSDNIAVEEEYYLWQPPSEP